MMTGTVAFYNRAKGFGFVTPDDLGNDAFLHISNLPLDHRYATEGDRVSFEPGTRNGRPLALKIQFLDVVKS
jgi:CspA family cold shock protein